MTETDKVRARLFGNTGLVTSIDFPQIKSASSILERLAQQGELRQPDGIDGWVMCSTGKPMKAYKVVALRMTQLQKKTSNEERAADPWRDVYPDLFMIHPPPLSMRVVTFRENGDIE